MEILSWQLLGIVILWGVVGAFGSFRLLMLHMNYGDVFHDKMTDVEFAMSVWFYMMLAVGGPGTLVMNWIARIDAKLTGRLPWMSEEIEPVRKSSGLGWPIKIGD